MMVIEAGDLDVRFADADMHGCLEKISSSWRSRLSSFFSGTINWVKFYYVLKKNILYIFEENNYDRPMKYLDLSLYTLVEARFKDFNRDFVFKLMLSQEEPISLAAENEERYKLWIERISEAIEVARERRI